MEAPGGPYIPRGYVAEGLLEGCSDLHVHACPEIVPGAVDDVTTAMLAREMGMRALVLKPFTWPTVRTAQFVESLVPGVRVYGGVVLNDKMGGLDPAQVDVAGRLGGKAVWMPTWSAANDLKRGGFSKSIRKYISTLDSHPIQGLSAVTEEGDLRPEAREIVRLAKHYDMVLFTGHLSVRESKMLAREARSCGFQKLVFSHPLSGSVGADHQDIREMAEMGAFIEHIALPTFPMQQRLKVSQIVEAAFAGGPERTILTSDATHPYNPPGPVMMQVLLASMLALGVSREAIYRMARENPAYLLGLPS